MVAEGAEFRWEEECTIECALWTCFGFCGDDEDDIGGGVVSLTLCIDFKEGLGTP